MSQIHQTSSGALEALDTVMAKFRTARAVHAVTAGESSGGTASIVLSWGTNFADTNYTVALAIAVLSGTQSNYAINSFTKTVSGITISVSVKGAGGDSIEVHALGIHD